MIPILTEGTHKTPHTSSADYPGMNPPRAVHFYFPSRGLKRHFGHASPDKAMRARSHGLRRAQFWRALGFPNIKLANAPGGLMRLGDTRKKRGQPCGKTRRNSPLACSLMQDAVGLKPFDLLRCIVEVFVKYFGIMLPKRGRRVKKRTISRI